MSDHQFQLKIKSIDNIDTDILVHNSLRISELKSLILSQVHVPIEKQRLLYHGKLLKDHQPLSFYNITPTSQLQLVAYLERPQEEGSISELIRFTLDSLPNSYISNRRGRNNRRREIDLSERMESIRQNLQTIENMLNMNRNFHKGQWIDAKDTVDQWLEAQVLDINSSSTGTSLFIHYIGWPNR